MLARVVTVHKNTRIFMFSWLWPAQLMVRLGASVLALEPIRRPHCFFFSLYCRPLNFRPIRAYVQAVSFVYMAHACILIEHAIHELTAKSGVYV